MPKLQSYKRRLLTWRLLKQLQATAVNIVTFIYGSHSYYWNKLHVCIVSSILVAWCTCTYMYIYTHSDMNWFYMLAMSAWCAQFQKVVEEAGLATNHHMELHTSCEMLYATVHIVEILNVCWSCLNERSTALSIWLWQHQRDLMQSNKQPWLHTTTLVWKG